MSSMICINNRKNLSRNDALDYAIKKEKKNMFEKEKSN